jgi:predicted metal-dependent hydrolase
LKKVRIPGVGEVQLERSKRARHICLTVRPFAGIRVAVPRGVTFQSAEQVARAKLPWLQKQIEKVASLERRAMELEKSHPIDCRNARRRLVERLDVLARKHGYTYNQVSIRNQKTRWGSCSAKNNISLNLQLIRLPAELIDYVILHELVHTRVKNHSQAFWDRLSALVGDAKTLDRRLNQYPLLQPGACKQVSD